MKQLESKINFTSNININNYNNIMISNYHAQQLIGNFLSLSPSIGHI